MGEQQLADRGVHGGQRGAHLDIRGHQVGVAQADEVEHAVAVEHGQVHRLSQALAEIPQLRRRDADEVQAAQRGCAEGQRAHPRPVVPGGQVIEVAFRRQRHHDPVDGRHGQTRDGGQVAHPPGRVLLVEQRQDAQPLGQGLHAVSRAFRRFRAVRGFRVGGGLDGRQGRG